MRERRKAAEGQRATSTDQSQREFSRVVEPARLCLGVIGADDMPNEPLGGRIEVPISQGIEDKTEFAKLKRWEAVAQLAEYGQALVDGNEVAAEEAMNTLRQAAREASEAERWVRQEQGAMDEARARAPDLGGWRDIINAARSGDLTTD